MPLLRKIMDFVERWAFVPILAWDYSVPADEVNDYDLRMVSNCRLGIFEVSVPEGEQMEIMRMLSDGSKVLLLYQIRDRGKDKMSEHTTKMLSTLKHENLTWRGFAHVDDLDGIIRAWLSPAVPD